MERETVLITASSKGLGKELAKTFALNGYDLILNGRNKSDIDKASEEIQRTGANFGFIHGDIRDSSIRQGLYEEAKRNNVGVLINNAAIPWKGWPLETITDDMIDENIGINLVAQLKLIRDIYCLFKENGRGTVINMNSIVCLEPKCGKGVHTASKAGLRAFSECMRQETDRVKFMEVYMSAVKTVPEYTFGMSPEFVANEIYKAHCAGNVEDLIIDGRPTKFKPAEDKLYKSKNNFKIVNGQEYSTG